jgi:hypothetical protein
MLGSEALMADLCRRLGVAPGRVGEDRRMRAALGHLEAADRWARAWLEASLQQPALA